LDLFQRNKTARKEQNRKRDRKKKTRWLTEGGRGESITVAAAALTERLLEVFSFLLAAVDPHISQSKFPSPELHIKAVARSSSLADRWPPTYNPKPWSQVPTTTKPTPITQNPKNPTKHHHHLSLSLSLCACVRECARVCLALHVCVRVCACVRVSLLFCACVSSDHHKTNHITLNPKNPKPNHNHHHISFSLSLSLRARASLPLPLSLVAVLSEEEQEEQHQCSQLKAETPTLEAEKLET